ncbi:hypothetical protein H0H10_28235 [Streptomyces sp. TRM S81-3]|uniref:Uncharacterized protein n=1 Tax=Streptomyces griseicoloratus TaxID=2752516 RepID=A0A926LAA5_9ACTN|nr:hypothetical protein [Streptomyces griseicoloratus]
MNLQEAADRAEQILDGTLAGIKPEVEAARGPSSDSVCTDRKNDGVGTKTVTRRRYVMTIISEDRRGNFLGVIERQWKRNGYEITSVRRNKEMPAIFASTPEGFRVSLEIGYKGQASFVVTSPCATESEVTEAPREPIDPDSPAGKGLPYAHSDFWSADTPLSSPSPGAGG